MPRIDHRTPRRDDERSKLRALARRAAKHGAPRRELAVEEVTPMLATPGGKPFSRAGWWFELKYDGYRMLAGKGGKPSSERGGAGARRGTRLRYRSGRDATAVFPELAQAVAALPAAHVVLDGEVVVLDAAGRPSFEALQGRTGFWRGADVERATVERPAAYFVFDLLALDGHDLRPLPLAERKPLLAELLPTDGPLRYTDHVEARGEELFAAVVPLGLEGLIAKRAASPYRAGRHADWLKIRAARSGDFAVVGWTEPKGSRSGFGALHVAALGADGWVWRGRVGTGFSEAWLAEIVARLAPDRRARPVAAVPAAEARGGTWVEPRLVVEVRYTEITSAGQLRHPVFLRLRPDKRVEECRVELSG